jgi:RNA polymerase sigma-70 factor (ECF subfamily)
VQVVLEGLLDSSQAAAQDRAQTFERLLRAHEQMVLRLAYRMLGSRADAEDAAQEVFLKLHRNLDRIDPSGGVHSWLYRTALNVCYDKFRRHRHYETVPELSVTPPQLETLLAAQQREMLQQALQRLPDRERAALVLRELEGLETEEVARLLGVSGVTVRTQVASARKKLKEWIAERMKR